MKVSPTGVFGVPDGDKTVLPAEAGRQIYGAAIRTSVLVPFGHGTLSEFRKDDEALTLNLEDCGIMLRAKDNFWTIIVEVDNVAAAHARVAPVLERLFHYLSTEYGVRFTYEGLFVDLSDGSTRRWPELKRVSMATMTMYDVKALQEHVEQAFQRAHQSDARLDKAYAYFESALQMRGAAVESDPVRTSTHLLWSIAFLQLWKTITIILGDPSGDRDYQKRFRLLGLPDTFWKEEVDPLYQVRSHEDVAHHKIDSDPSVVQAAFGKAVGVAKRALRAYSDHLKDASRTVAADDQ